MQTDVSRQYTHCAKPFNLAAIACVLVAISLGGCASQSVPVENLADGQTYASRACAQCHDVTSRTSQPFATLGAPDFYAIANARTTSAIGLNAFLMTPHPTMPNLIIEAEDRHNVIAYILSLRRTKNPEHAGI